MIYFRLVYKGYLYGINTGWRNIENFTICNGFSPSIDYLFVLLTRVGRVALIWYGPRLILSVGLSQLGGPLFCVGIEFG